MESVAVAVRRALLACNPRDKIMLTRKAARDWRLGRLQFAFDVAMPDTPGRPARPELLPPNQMPRRGCGQSLRGRVALYHAIAHIEFTAIDLALDIVGRFGGVMEPGFTSDFLSVAADEALHFALLERHLRALGSHYGELPAHAGLWEAADDTRHDVAARLAVVPMVLEARGLDVTPMMLERVRSVGDTAGFRILTRILDDEIRHVRFGSIHFAALANQRGESFGEMWKSLVKRHFNGSLKPPFNDSARQSAGLPRELYTVLAC